jgi:4-hydroxy-4-methyl-2-oxoglutarate aldolase
MKTQNSNLLNFFALILAVLFLRSSLIAQPLSMSRDQIIQYTPLWKGERSADGRPKVSDDIIARMKYVTISEAWASVRNGIPSTTATPSGTGRPASSTQYNNQYYGGFKEMFDNVTICGRALTIQFMPSRPDLNGAIQEQGKKEGHTIGITYGIEKLVKGDVYVANVSEGIDDASHVGDNLGNAIWALSGNGAIIQGTVRDIEGNMHLEGFNLFVRDFRPQSAGAGFGSMVIGVNLPIQIGYVTVMPGDIVLGKRDGVIFIPPHLAQIVVENSERSRLRDAFAHLGVQQGRLTAAQADSRFTYEMNEEFNQWALENADTMRKFFSDPNAAPSPEFIRAYIKDRQSGAAR